MPTYKTKAWLKTTRLVKYIRRRKFHLFKDRDQLRLKDVSGHPADKHFAAFGRLLSCTPVWRWAVDALPVALHNGVACLVGQVQEAVAVRGTSPGTPVIGRRGWGRAGSCRRCELLAKVAQQGRRPMGKKHKVSALTLHSDFGPLIELFVLFWHISEDLLNLLLPAYPEDSSEEGS